MRLVPLYALVAAISASTPVFAASMGSETHADSTNFPYNAISTRPAIKPSSAADQQKTLAALQATLTELQQLQLQVKQAHWNVSGVGFYELHEMLQEHYEGLSKYADMTAERMLAIGGSSDGRAHTIVQDSQIREIPGGFLDGAFVTQWFTDAYNRAGERIDKNMRAINNIDPTTSNLLQEVETGIAKYQWQARAFTQPTPTNPNSGRDMNNGVPAPTIETRSH